MKLDELDLLDVVGVGQQAVDFTCLEIRAVQWGDDRKIDAGSQQRANQAQGVMPPTMLKSQIG